MNFSCSSLVYSTAVRSRAFFLIIVHCEVCWNMTSFVQACGMHCEQLAYLRLCRASSLAEGHVMRSLKMCVLELVHNTGHVQQTKSVFFFPLEKWLLCKHFGVVIVGHLRVLYCFLFSKLGLHVCIPCLTLPCAVLASFFCNLN